MILKRLLINAAFNKLVDHLPISQVTEECHYRIALLSRQLN